MTYEQAKVKIIKALETNTIAKEDFLPLMEVCLDAVGYGLNMGITGE